MCEGQALNVDLHSKRGIANFVGALGLGALGSLGGGLWTEVVLLIIVLVLLDVNQKTA